MADKPKIVKFPEVAVIEAEAAAWVARFDGGNVSAEELAKFQSWSSKSALHRDAVEQYGKLWTDFDKMNQLTAALESGRDAIEQGAHPSAKPISRRWFAYVAGAGIAATLAAVVVYRGFEEPPPVVTSYETEVGGQKNALLPDGSAVTLNTNSRIDVRISRHSREVHLVRGEVYFEVTHDDQRPFTVFAGRGLVRDVGTAFDVRLMNGAVNVSVARGSVEISAITPKSGASGSAAQRLATVNAGQDVLFDRKIEHSERISDADLNRRLAWRQGVLIYAGEPLATVVADISRYSNIKVELDQRLRDRRVGGSFKVSQIREVFTALESNFGIHSEWVSDRQVRITSARDGSTRHK